MDLKARITAELDQINAGLAIAVERIAEYNKDYDEKLKALNLPPEAYTFVIEELERQRYDRKMFMNQRNFSQAEARAYQVHLEEFRQELNEERGQRIHSDNKLSSLVRALETIFKVLHETMPCPNKP